jgi:DNA-directed RNA polymerase specialized sigma24 family protein
MSPPPFQRFLDAHRDEVHRFLVALAGPDDAEDCFQETFIAALRAYPRLESGENLRAWVFTIARRKAIDARRARARRAVPMGGAGDLALDVSGGGAGGSGLDIPGGGALGAIGVSGGDADGGAGLPDTALWDCVRALPPKQRAAVALRFVADLSHAEIARALGCSPEAARRSLHEALIKLRKDWQR